MCMTTHNNFIARRLQIIQCIAPTNLFFDPGKYPAIGNDRQCNNHTQNAHQYNKHTCMCNGSG